MSTIGKTLLIASIAALFLGCSAKEEELEGVIPEGYKKAVIKAENVEGLLKDTQAQRTEELD